MLPTDAQPYLAMMEGDWEGAPGASSATGHPVLSSSRGSLVLEERYRTASQTEQCSRRKQLLDMPNEVLLHILSYLDVCDLLATSRVRQTPSSSPPYHVKHSPSSFDSLTRPAILNIAAAM
jgi:hypothetical protein